MAELGIESRLDPEESIRGGAQYRAGIYARFGNIKRAYFSRTQYGYARGTEPVRSVTRIRIC